MKKRTQCAGAALAALLAACAARPKPGEPEPLCADRLVTVTHAPGYLAAYPEHVDVCAGRTVVIELEPAVEPGAARTTPAPGLPEWLGARNARGDRIEIRVPEDAAYATYKYEIVVEGVGRLDPRLTVSRR